MRNFGGFALVIGAIALTGCSSAGTTYGTGTSHEKATLNSFYNMLSIKPKDPANIDYSARPDLVMPAASQTLPTPGSGIEQSDGQNWPVSPEQRIADIRANVPEVDERSGDLPTEYLLSEKPGIRNSSGLYVGARSTRASEELPVVDPNAQNQRNEVQRRREELAYSTGVKRKFLTEPPSEYRQPATTAEAGDLGVTSEYLEEQQKRAKKEELNRERGVIDVVAN